MLHSSYIIFISILVFAPLAFGSVAQWSLTILEGLSLCALVVFLIGNSRTKDGIFYEVPGILPLLCLWSYFVIQIIPLPSYIVRLISPETYKLYAETVGIMETAAWMSLSVHKKETLLELLRLTGYFAFYILTIQLLANRALLKKTVNIIVIFSSVLAIYALLQYLSGANKIYWFRETYGASPFGPFVNRNHYAGFMEMLFPVALALFLAMKPKFSYSGLRERLLEFLKEKRTNMHILFGLGAVIIAFSIFLSLSRGGIISLSLSMLFFSALLLTKKTRRNRMGIMILIMGLIVTSVSWFGWEPILARFERLLNVEGNIADLRAQIWMDSFQIISSFPVTGTGFGTFIDIYPKYATLTDEIIIQHAHNDYIELLTNGGVIAFLLAGWFVFTVIFKSFKMFLRRRDSYSVYLYIGAITGIIAVLLHGFTDFNFQIGSNGLYFFFLMGLLVSLANTRFKNGLDNTYLKPVKNPAYKIVPFFASAMLLFVMTANLGIIIGQHYYSYIKDLRLDRVGREDLIEVKGMALKASIFDPLESGYSYSAANVDILLNNPESAKKYYLTALKLNILNGEYAQKLGLAYASEDVILTERLLKAGISSEPTNHTLYKTYAEWLQSENRRDESIMNIKKAVSISPNTTAEYINLMLSWGFRDEDIMQSLPERVVPYITFADYLLDSGSEKQAEDAYLKALLLSTDPKEAKPSYFHKVYNFYFKLERYEDALKVAQQAKTLFPLNGGFRNSAGIAYEKLNMPEMAANEYKEALQLEPANKHARIRLKSLTEIKN